MESTEVIYAKRNLQTASILLATMSILPAILVSTVKKTTSTGERPELIYLMPTAILIVLVSMCVYWAWKYKDFGKIILIAMIIAWSSSLIIAVRIANLTHRPYTSSIVEIIKKNINRRHNKEKYQFFSK